MTLSDIRAEARRIENSTNYEHAAKTPVKRLAALVVALVDHIEQQPVQTVGTVNPDVVCYQERVRHSYSPDGTPSITIDYVPL